jgi:hypothetical protein
VQKVLFHLKPAMREGKRARRGHAQLHAVGHGAAG